MGICHRIEDQIRAWPVYRQIAGAGRLGRGAAARSRASGRLTPRTQTADAVVRSVCPYCAAGCGQNVYVAGGRLTQIKGGPASPASRGRLCPKGSASRQLSTGPGRRYQLLSRGAYGAQWETLDLDTAMDMIAGRVIDARPRGRQCEADGARTHRTLGLASLGGATLDNEENYLIKELLTS